MKSLVNFIKESKEKSYTTKTTSKKFWDAYFEDSNVTLNDFENACDDTDLAALGDDKWATPDQLFKQYQANEEVTLTARNMGNFIDVTIKGKSLTFATSIISDGDNSSDLFKEIYKNC